MEYLQARLPKGGSACGGGSKTFQGWCTCTEVDASYSFEEPPLDTSGMAYEDPPSPLGASLTASAFEPSAPEHSTTTAKSVSAPQDAPRANARSCLLTNVANLTLRSQMLEHRVSRPSQAPLPARRPTSLCDSQRSESQALISSTRTTMGMLQRQQSPPLYRSVRPQVPQAKLNASARSQSSLMVGITVASQDSLNTSVQSVQDWPMLSRQGSGYLQQGALLSASVAYHAPYQPLARAAPVQAPAPVMLTAPPPPSLSPAPPSIKAKPAAPCRSSSHKRVGAIIPVVRTCVATLGDLDDSLIASTRSRMSAATSVPGHARSYAPPPSQSWASPAIQGGVALSAAHFGGQEQVELQPRPRDGMGISVGSAEAETCASVPFLVDDDSRTLLSTRSSVAYETHVEAELSIHRSSSCRELPLAPHWRSAPHLLNPPARGAPASYAPGPLRQQSAQDGQCHGPVPAANSHKPAPRRQDLKENQPPPANTKGAGGKPGVCHGVGYVY